MSTINGSVYNKIILDGSGYAYIETPNGRFVIDPDLDSNYHGVYISFQPRPDEKGVVPGEQQLVYVQEIQENKKVRPKMRVAVWEDCNNEGYTYNNPDIEINKEIWKTAEN